MWLKVLFFTSIGAAIPCKFLPMPPPSLQPIFFIILAATDSAIFNRKKLNFRIISNNRSNFLRKNDKFLLKTNNKQLRVKLNYKKENIN